MQYEIFPLLAQSDKNVLIATSTVSCGEGSDVCTELERIDLNEYVTQGQDGVYLIRIVGDSMEADIKNGDIVVANRNLSPSAGDIVVASVNGSYTIKIYQPFHNGLYLVPKNTNYKKKTVTAKDTFEVFGVVTDVLHRLKKF